MTLATIIVLQSLWQFDHRGASQSIDAVHVANILTQRFSEKQLIIQQADVFARLPENPHWLFLTNPLLSQRLPPPFGLLSEAQRCLPVLRKLAREELRELGQRAQTISGPYFLIAPSPSC